MLIEKKMIGLSSQQQLRHGSLVAQYLTYVLVISIHVAAGFSTHGSIRFPFALSNNKLSKSFQGRTLPACNSNSKPITQEIRCSIGLNGKSKNSTYKRQHGATKLSLVSSAEDKESRSGTSELLFLAQKTYLSEKIMSYGNDEEDIKTKMQSFFQQQLTIQTLLGGANENEVIQLSPGKTAELLDGTQSKFDAVYTVTTDGIQFPGLKLTSKASIGTSQKDTTNDTFPCLQLIFIKDEQKVEGTKLSCWIFNKLTGGDKRNGDEEQTTSATTLITITTDGVENGFMIQVDTKLQVKVKFPAILLKILPVSKAKAEEQGTLSLEKVLDKDFNAVLPRLSSQLTTWMQTFDSNTNI